MEFANWLSRLEWICWRFMQLSFFDVEDLCDDRVSVREVFEFGSRPERYFVDVILNVLEDDLGCMDVEELLFESVMWGVRRGH